MRIKIPRIFLFLFFISVPFLSLYVPSVAVELGVIRVPDDYPTIQAAIDASNPGDTILVASGMYYERVDITKNNLSLIGENKENTVIDGEKHTLESVVEVFANNTYISGFTIQHSDADFGCSGIAVFQSCNTTIRDNIVRENFENINLWASNGTVIRDNIIGNKSDEWIGYQAGGIWLRDWSSRNLISNNFITITDSISIVLGYNANNNIVTNNTVANSRRALLLWNCSDNVFFHNNFVNNTFQVDSSDSVNVWDDGYPSGGNYWSDYTGTDLYNGPYQNVIGSDGVGDTSYVIDSNNQDNYPFISQNGWQTHPISIQSNVTITSINVNRCSLNFTASGPTGQTGYVNVTIPVGLNQTEIKVFVDNVRLIPPPFPIITSNGTHCFIYVEFTLSTHELRILFTKVGDLGGDLPPKFFNFDDLVDGKDLNLFLQCYRGEAPREVMYVADLGGGVPPKFFECDGVVDGKDLVLFLQCYKGQGP